MAAHSLLANLPSTTQLLNQTTLHRTHIPKSLLPHSLKLSTPKQSFSWLTAAASTINSTQVSTFNPISATVVPSLPTANPERFSSADEVPKWSSKAIKAFCLSYLEARKLKYSSTGTEALLMGITIEGTSFAAKYLWINGITILKVREECIRLFDRGYYYYKAPQYPPLTDAAQRALDWAVDHKLKSGKGGEITSSDMLLGIWSEVDSPGYQILSNLGFNDEKAKELESLSSVPGFVDD